MSLRVRSFLVRPGPGRQDAECEKDNANRRADAEHVGMNVGVGFGRLRSADGCLEVASEYSRGVFELLNDPLLRLLGLASHGATGFAQHFHDALGTLRRDLRRRLLTGLDNPVHESLQPLGQAHLLQFFCSF